MRRRRHLILLICILLLFIATPFFGSLRRGMLFFDVIAAVLLLFGAYAVSQRKYEFVIAIVLSASWLCINAAMLMFPNPAVGAASHACILAVLIYLTIVTLRYVLQSGRVNADKLYAAICVYMLIGYGWTFGYTLLDDLSPGAFSSSEAVRPYSPARVLQLRYFSFMTLTTTGYGDILPATQAARSMAVVEAVMGQMYLAVLIARLVGLHIVHGSDSGKSS